MTIIEGRTDPSRVFYHTLQAASIIENTFCVTQACHFHTCHGHTHQHAHTQSPGTIGVAALQSSRAGKGPAAKMDLSLTVLNCALFTRILI